MSIRTERLEAVLQKDIGHILQRNYQMSGTFLTVREVDISPDLMNASVFISVYAPEHDEESIFGNLQDKKVDIRQTLASKIRHQVRRIPELHFKMDKSAEHVQRMEELFEQIHEEKAKRNGEEG